MRLWTVTKAKEFCSDWNMKIFFQVVHNDMERCLEHLNDLRLPGELKILGKCGEQRLQGDVGNEWDLGSRSTGCLGEWFEGDTGN
jgi:hypothetical protein